MPHTALQPYVMTDFKNLAEGTRFVLAYEYANTQDELPLGLDWRNVYAELSKAEETKNNPFRNFRDLLPGFSLSQEMVKFRNAGNWLNGLGAGSVGAYEKVITGPPLRELVPYGGDLPSDAVDLLLKVLAEGAYHIEQTRLASDRAGLAAFSSNRQLAKTQHLLRTAGFLDYGTRKTVSLTNLGVLRALQELDKL